MSSDLVPVKRALLSVSDKTGLAEFARALHHEFKIELISTGGTAKFLRDQALAVTDVSDITGFPEMMDGRIKTLHPLIHGGLLALRDNPEHAAAMQKHGIKPIDLVCINLYPFEQTISKPDVTFEEAIEDIDIGGPAMIRSAAKNHRYVLVVTSTDRYEKVLGDLREHAGSSCGKHRLKQAQRAFEHTARYDALISDYLSKAVGTRSGGMQLNLTKAVDLRYGENPHQKAALYVDEKPNEPSVAFARQLHGKELSYINLLDADAALGCAKEFDRPAACIVKHATPCGAAIADDVATAFARAYEADSRAAFGGIVALNRDVDLAAATAITSIDKLLEVIVVPRFTDDALQVLRDRWKSVRLLEVGSLPGGTGFQPVRGAQHGLKTRATDDAAGIHMHKIMGGYLVQDRDTLGLDESTWKVVTHRKPDASELADLRFAWLVCKHVKSNAIVLARDGATVGIGGGSVDRVGSARIAIEKARDRARGSVAASDAFFPFADGPQLLLNAGVTAIIQPGGSVRDADSITAVDRASAAMIFTSQRHFRH
jgi:phosphoribosylaminoimidazolecarboxamide formyltransferase/IMP cyclohydrolase